MEEKIKEFNKEFRKKFLKMGFKATVGRNKNSIEINSKEMNGYRHVNKNIKMDFEFEENTINIKKIYKTKKMEKADAEVILVALDYVFNIAKIKNIEFVKLSTPFKKDIYEKDNGFILKKQIGFLENVFGDENGKIKVNEFNLSFEKYSNVLKKMKDEVEKEDGLLEIDQIIRHNDKPENELYSFEIQYLKYKKEFYLCFDKEKGFVFFEKIKPDKKELFSNFGIFLEKVKKSQNLKNLLNPQFDKLRILIVVDLNGSWENFEELKQYIMNKGNYDYLEIEKEINSQKEKRINESIYGDISIKHTKISGINIGVINAIKEKTIVFSEDDEKFKEKFKAMYLKKCGEIFDQKIN